MATLVLTVTADDRPGLVSDLATVVAAHDGNWRESQLARLAGTFAGIVLVDVPDDRAEALGAAVGGLVDVRVTVTRTALAGTEPTGAVWTVQLLGQDQPGIVAELSRTLTDNEVTIEDLQTSTSDMPMAGGVLFRADARVRPVDGGGPERLRTALEAIAGRFLVDIDLAVAD